MSNRDPRYFKVYQDGDDRELEQKIQDILESGAAPGIDVQAREEIEEIQRKIDSGEIGGGGGGAGVDEKAREDIQKVNTELAKKATKEEITQISTEMNGLGQRIAQNDEPFFEVPNGVKNSIEGNNLIRKVAEYTLKEEDIIGIFAGKNISLVRIAKPTDYIGYGKTKTNDIHDTGIHEFGMNFRNLTSAYDQTTHIGKMIVGESDKQIWYIIEKNSMTIEQAKTMFVGTKMWYQLTTSVQVQAKVSANVKEILKLRDGGGNSGRQSLSYTLPPDTVSGFFVENKTKTYAKFANANEVTQAFRSLAASHSKFMTETLCGNDSSGQHPIYSYRLNPGGASTENLTKGFSRIIWVAGQHGCERTAVMASYHFVKNMLENWKEHPVLEWLRWNFVFEFIPLANPWGYNQGDGFTGDANLGRLNSNGVNLNRNWGELWKATEAGVDYAGTAAFSEVETRYMKDLVDRSTKAIAFFDFHTNNSTGDIYDNLLWISANEGSLLDENLLIASKYTVEKQSRDFMKKYNIPTDKQDRPFGYVSSSNISTGSAKAYGASKGIPSITLECFRKFPFETSYYSNDTLQACTEYLANATKTAITQKINMY